MELPLPPAKKQTSTSDVLTNTDLLEKILLCLECRSCHMSAALTSKCWLCAASRHFVPDFCARHRPRLLGVYVSSDGISGSEFIPLPDASSPEHADFSFGDLSALNVWDCRNGMVLFEFGDDDEAAFHFHPAGLAVRSPLLYHMEVLPEPLETTTFSECPYAFLLPTDHGDDASCYRISVLTRESGNEVRATALVCVLRSGDWSIHRIAKGALAKSPVQVLPTTTVLAGGKIYMATEAGYILGVELKTESFFIVDLPEGVELDWYLGNLVHCRGEDDSVLYLFHVDRDNRLNVWRRQMNDDHAGHSGAGAGAAGGANGWVLRDTISVRETCGHLVKQCRETAGDGDEDFGAAIMVVGTGDNGEFVFLELGITGVVVYMHLKTREVKQVYQREPYDDHLISVRPFMFVGPPVFPALDLDAQEGEAAAPAPAPHQE